MTICSMWRVPLAINRQSNKIDSHLIVDSGYGIKEELA